MKNNMPISIKFREFLKSSITAVLFTLFTFGNVQAQDNINLPDIGDSSGAIISEQDEKAYGAALMREFRRRATIMDDPLIDVYIYHLGYSLVSYSDQPGKTFNFFVVADDRVNAFAAPGGYIGIHSQLLLTADNESEVAAVLAHEVAHVTQRHLARAVESAQKVSTPLALLMLGAAVAASGDADALQTALVGGQALLQQLQINFTRNNEYEADRLGIKILADAGYDPDGMAGFFGKMARISRNYGRNIPEFLRTHPVETTRIAEAKNRATKIEVKTNPARNPDYFLLIRERIRVLRADRPNELIGQYLQWLDHDGPSEHNAYGLALAYHYANDSVGASEALDRVDKKSLNKLPFQLLLADIELKSGFDQSARKRFENLIKRYPGHLAVSIAYAEAIMETGNKADIELAEKTLKPLLSKYSQEALLHLIYSRAADQSGHKIRAGQAYAQYVLLQGRVYDAVTQLRNMLKEPALDYYERSRLQARLAELEPILAQIERHNGYDPSEGKETDRRRRLQNLQQVGFSLR